MLWKHKFQVILLWAVLSAVTVVVVYRIPPTYEAKATILVDSQQIPDKFVTSTINSEVEDRIASLKQEILAPSKLLALINTFGLYKEERKTTPEEEILDRMSKDTKVVLERGWTKDRPGAFQITYQGSDPRKVMQVTQAIMDAFITENEEKRKLHAEKTSDFLKDRLDTAREDLKKQEAALANYKLQHNNELPQQQGSLGATLSRLQLELQANEDAINRAQQNKLMAENSINSSEASVASLVSMMEQSTTAANASAGTTASAQSWSNNGQGKPQKESEVLQARLDLLRVRYGDEHPEIKRLRAEIAQLKEAETKTAAETAQVDRHTKPAAATAEAPAGSSRVMAETLGDQLVKEKERLAHLKSQLALANQELEFRSNERKGIVANIKNYETRLENLPKREQDLEGLTRDYEISKENYRSLLDKKLAAEMSSEMEKRQQAEKFTPLAYPRVPEIPIKPKRPLLIAAGCVAGLMLSLVLAAGREMKRGTLLGEWELPPGVVVMGRVPWIEIHPDGSLETGYWRRKGLPLALLSSAVLFACGIAAVYLGWVSL